MELDYKLKGDQFEFRAFFFCPSQNYVSAVKRYLA